MRHYLGIDIGTFESKGVLVDQVGRIVGQAARAHQMLVPRPGWAEHRADEDWWGDFAFLCRKLLGETRVPASSIAAVAPSAIGPCMLPVDGEGRPLMNGVLYGVDTRAIEEIAELTGQVGVARLVEKCGNALTSQSVAPKILWLQRKRPDLFAATRKVLTSTSYLVYRLTGEYVIDHYTAANSAPCYLVDEMEWSDALAPGFVDLDLMPRLAWTTDIVGAVTQRAAEETGLAVGTPVTAGTIDAAAEAVSVGVDGVGDMMIMYGSTIFIVLITAERVRDPRLWYAPWLFPGRHASLSGLSTSGTLTHWFRREFARELRSDTAFAALVEEAAASPPGARGIVVLPYFSGERTPIHDAGAKGVVFGLDLTHTRGDLFRAFLEGIAFGTSHIMDTYREAGQAPRLVYAVGGGTRNRVWAQAISDVADLRQIVRFKTIGASYGDALLAAIAVGDVKADVIGAWNPVEREFVPDPANADVYRRQYKVFRELYPRTRELMR